MKLQFLAKKLQKALDSAVNDQQECGCQLCIFEDGEPVLDLVAGYTDATRTQKVTPATRFPVFSVGKGLVAGTIHRLVEQGKLAYDAPLADYWPEFGNQGKENIRLWHVLSHRSALVTEPQFANPNDWADWSLVCRKLAAMPPDAGWLIGGKCHYHALTFGHLAGEPACRVTGLNFNQIIKKEVLDPLAIEEFSYGVPPELDTLCADLDGSAFAGATPWPIAFLTPPAIKRGIIPAANAFSSARAIASYYAGLQTGRLLNPETLQKATALCRDSADPLAGWSVFGLGFVLPNYTQVKSDIFGHGGAAGSEGFACLSRHLAVGFTKNKINSHHPDHALRNQISAILALPERIW